MPLARDRRHLADPAYNDPEALVDGLTPRLLKLEIENSSSGCRRHGLKARLPVPPLKRVPKLVNRFMVPERAARVIGDVEAVEAGSGQRLAAGLPAIATGCQAAGADEVSAAKDRSDLSPPRFRTATPPAAASATSSDRMPLPLAIAEDRVRCRRHRSCRAPRTSCRSRHCTQLRLLEIARPRPTVPG